MKTLPIKMCKPTIPNSMPNRVRSLRASMRFFQCENTLERHAETMSASEYVKAREYLRQMIGYRLYE